MKTKRNKAAGRGRPSPACSRLARTTWAGRKEEIELLTQEEMQAGEHIGHPIAPELARPLATSKWAGLLPKKEVAHILRITEANFFKWDSPISAVLTRAAESYDPDFDPENDRGETRTAQLETPTHSEPHEND